VKTLSFFCKSWWLLKLTFEFKGDVKPEYSALVRGSIPGYGIARRWFEKTTLS